MGRARSVPSKNIPLAVLALSVSFLAALAFGGPVQASQLVDRNARNVHIQVNAKGQALITYRASGRLRRVLGWGAINARPSSSGGKQVSFRLDYSGGWGTYHRRLWQAFPDTCRRYDGPMLTNVVASCTAGDGSYWAPAELASCAAGSRVPSLAACSEDALADALALERPNRGAGGAHGLDLRRPIPARVRAAHLSGPSGVRLRHDATGSSDGSLRAPALPRHFERARLRARLAARELVRHPQGHRCLLLRLLPP